VGSSSTAPLTSAIGLFHSVHVAVVFVVADGRKERRTEDKVRGEGPLGWPPCGRTRMSVGRRLSEARGGDVETGTDSAAAAAVDERMQ